MELHITPLSIEDSKRIGVVNTQFDTAFPTKMKQITGSRWTPEHNCWHIPYTKEAWQTFEQLFEGHTIIRISPETTPETKSMVEVAIVEKTTEPKIIARRCAEQPDRIFLSLPQDRIDWTTYISKVDNSMYHSMDALWSVPRTKALYQQFADYFGASLVVDKETPIVLAIVEATMTRSENVDNRPNVNAKHQNGPPQYSRFKDKLTVFEHPTKQDYWCLNLPKTLVTMHLQTVRNIQGRIWNNALFVWDIPKTALSQQFLDTYLPHLIHWDCQQKTTSLPINQNGVVQKIRRPLFKMRLFSKE